MTTNTISSADHLKRVSLTIHGKAVKDALIYIPQSVDDEGFARNKGYLLHNDLKGSHPGKHILDRYGYKGSWCINLDQANSDGIDNIAEYGSSPAEPSDNIRSLRGLEGEIVMYGSTEGALYKESGDWFLLNNSLQGAYPWSREYNRSQAESIIYEITNGKYKYAYYLKAGDEWNWDSILRLTRRSITFTGSPTRDRLQSDKIDREIRDLERIVRTSSFGFSSPSGYKSYVGSLYEAMGSSPAWTLSELKSPSDSNDENISIEVRKEKKTRRPVEVEPMRNIEV